MRERTLRQRLMTMEEAYQQARPARLLLAEDDARLRGYLAEALRGDGYQVVEAQNGRELASQMSSSLEPARHQEPIDMVISGSYLKGWSGIEALRRVRQLDWALPFVLLAPGGDDQTREDARRLGATAVFDRPFDVDDLRSLITNLVS